MIEMYVARAIIFENDAVLLGERARGFGAGKFALPGGKPDKGETMRQALEREILEELGATMVNIQLFKRFIDSETEPNVIWHAAFFTGNLNGEIHLKEDEISRVAYVREHELDKYDITFGHEKILKQFFAKRK